MTGCFVWRLTTGNDTSDVPMALERRNVFKKALEDFREEIPAARRELEREFREYRAAELATAKALEADVADE